MLREIEALSMSEEFLLKVLSYIKNPFIKNSIRKELESHLQDRIESLEMRGVDKFDAEKRSVESMGSAEILGQQLNEIHKPFLSYFVLLSKALVLIAILSLSFSVIVPGIKKGIEYYQESKYQNVNEYISLVDKRDFSQVKSMNQEFKFLKRSFTLKEFHYSQEHDSAFFVFNEKIRLIPSPYSELQTDYQMNINCGENKCYLASSSKRRKLVYVEKIKNKNELIMEFDTGLNQSTYRINLEGIYE